MAKAQDIEGLSPGIKDVVLRLRELEFETTDSGDGTNLANGMECALSYRHVAMTVKSPALMVEEADRLNWLVHEQERLAGDWTIQATYDPEDGSCLIFMFEAGQDG